MVGIVRGIGGSESKGGNGLPSPFRGVLLRGSRVSHRKNLFSLHGSNRQSAPDLL